MGLYSRIIDTINLNTAWGHIKRNKPAAGVDDVSWEDFEGNLSENILQLNLELQEHTYEVSPVKMVKLRQEDKYRDVSLYTMRDKVVQTSLATELTSRLDSSFSKHTYAYRPNTSALNAISEIEKIIMDGKYAIALKTDVRGFFDNINQTILKKMLEDELKELDVVELIMSIIRTPMLGKDGTLLEKQVGIYQGASISPILSNLYLRKVDLFFMQDSFFYGRYADDIIMLFSDVEEAENAFIALSGMLENLELSINQDKTYIRTISEGFDFLGYHFDNTGKSVPVKAEAHLEQSLEDVWLSMIGADIEDRLIKGSQILNGWEQYYRDERPIGSIYEYAVVIYMMRHKKELQSMLEKRRDFANTQKDICRYLAEVWSENGWLDYVILEYEQYFEIASDYSSIDNKELKEEIISLFSKLIILQDVETWNSLMQSYSDAGKYERAELVSNKALECAETISTTGVFTYEQAETDYEVNYSRNTLETLFKLFAGREDMYSREYININHQRKTEYVAAQLNINVLKKHMDGQETIGTYLVRSNDTVKYAVFDVDIIKKILMQNGNDALPEFLSRAGSYVLRMKGILHDMGLKTYIEFSGYRGYHLWLFFTEWVPLRYVYTLQEMVRRKLGEMDDEALSLECFPMQNRRKSGHAGQNVKMPYGIHLSSGKRSYFVDDTFEPYDDIDEFVEGIAKYTVENLKRVIGNYISDESVKLPSKAKGKIELDYSLLDELPDSVNDVLRGCTLMQYLVNKAITTGYLSHFERLSILNVFGHIGEDGADFVHKVMSFTINYQYNVTQMFIKRMFDKPVSCVKLREQYKLISAEYGCNCAFKRTKDCYPSPVIHALRDNNENNMNITVPISKTLTKTKTEEVIEELNYSSKVDKMAAQLGELNKQKRSINKSIRKIERELVNLFDNAKTDCMEIEMGMLIRQKNTDGAYDWIIDI